MPSSAFDPPAASCPRRDFLGRLGAAALALPAALAAEAASPAARLTPPRFPQRDFAITSYGARPDGRDCTHAIARAIAACHAAGGGRVLVPGGIFHTGKIHLRSGVNLHLAADATLRFSTDHRAYLPLVRTRWEGIECFNYSPLIYAYRQHDIAVTGAGTLDGQASDGHWWVLKGRRGFGWRPGQPQQQPARARLHEYGRLQTPLAQRRFGPGAHLRPAFVQPFDCRNVLIEGVRIIRSPMYEIHPVFCRNLLVRGVRIHSLGPNNDGCDPDSCSHVLIENCSFTTGDDCISIKSGRDRDGRRIGIPCEHVLIRNCVMHAGHGGVAIGSEMSGGVRDVRIENCRMPGTAGGFGLDYALRIKSNPHRGGTVSRVIFENIRAGRLTHAALELTLHYGHQAVQGRHWPHIEDVTIRNFLCRQARMGLRFEGLPGDPITDLTLENCRILRTGEPDLVRYLKNVRVRGLEVNGRKIAHL